MTFAHLLIPFTIIKTILFAFQSITFFYMLKNIERLTEFRTELSKKILATVAALVGIFQITFDILLVLPVARQIPRAIFKGNLPVIVISVLIFVILANKNFYKWLDKAKDFRTALRLGTLWYMLSVVVRAVVKIVQFHISSNFQG